MTNKEAVELLKPLFDQCKGTDRCLGYIEHYFTKAEEKALDLAIKALEERPQGYWAEFEGGYRCSNCDDIEVYTPNFCPNCGADMRSEEG